MIYLSQYWSNPSIVDIFETAHPIFRAARGTDILLLGPLQRYAVARCCEDPSHLKNLRRTAMLKEVGMQLKNLLYMKQVKNVKLLNPGVLIEIYGTPPPPLSRCSRPGDWIPSTPPRQPTTVWRPD